MEEQAAPVENQEVDPNASQEAEKTTEDSKPEESAPQESGNYVEDVDPKVQARINKLTAEKYAERRRAEDLERQLRETQPQQVTERPTLEGHDYDEQAFTSALIKYEVDQKAKEIQSQQSEGLQQSQRADNQASFNARVVEQMAEVSDYDQAVSLLPQFPEETFQAMLQAEDGPKLAYFLGKHLDVADQIAQSPPGVAAMQLGRISAQLNGKPNVKPSAAPEPIEPINSSGSLSKNVEDMSMEEVYNS